MKRISICLSIISLLISCSGQPGGSLILNDGLYDDLPFEMEKVARPVIPSYRVNLADFDAKGNGIFLNTEAFAAAIDALEARGGGHLDVPAGIWLTGPVSLKSNIDLHLSEGAVILFDPDKALYPIISTSFEGLNTKRCESPINADHASKIACEIALLNISGCTVRNFGTGQGMFDMRAGNYGSILIENSTICNGGRDFIRADAGTNAKSIAVRSNTFASTGIGAGNGLFWVRAAADSYVVADNHFFNCDAEYFWSGTYSQEEGVANGGSVLEADPCADALNGITLLQMPPSRQQV